MTLIRSFGKSKQQIAVLKPVEVINLLNVIPKYAHKVMTKTLIYSGMRYIETRRLQDNPQWFNGQFIDMYAGKPKAQMNQRYVHLNPQGREIIGAFVNLEQHLPAYSTFGENIKRWASKANIDTNGLCPKSFRKTWESWLIFYYPDKILSIMQSQGHNEKTSIEHYLNLAFTSEDRNIMKSFVEGWE